MFLQIYINLRIGVPLEGKEKPLVQLMAKRNFASLKTEIHQDETGGQNGDAGSNKRLKVEHASLNDDSCCIIRVRDVVFSVKKTILAKESPVLSSLFSGSNPSRINLTETGVSAEAFSLFFRYLHGLSVAPSSIEQASQLCLLANKYKVPTLAEFMAMFLLPQMTLENTPMFLNWGVIYNIPSLQNAALKNLCKHASKVLGVPSMENVHRSTLLLVLRQTEMNIESELHVFKMVQRWAHAQLRAKGIIDIDEDLIKRTIGNEAIALIRFGAITTLEYITNMHWVTWANEIAKSRSVDLEFDVKRKPFHQ